MVDENGAWARQGEAFWRAHHEAWKRSDLNQRQYCEAEGIPLKAFGNWRVIFKAEPQPPERKLLWRRRGLSPPFSPQLSPPFSPPLNPGVYRTRRAAPARRNVAFNESAPKLKMATPPCSLSSAHRIFRSGTVSGARLRGSIRTCGRVGSQDQRCRMP